MTDGNTYAINRRLNDQDDFDALQEVTAELEQAEARIEELEGKLAKAVEALMFYADPTYNGYDVCIGDYGLSVDRGCIIQDNGDLARITLTELTKERSDEKGQDDG